MTQQTAAHTKGGRMVGGRTSEGDIIIATSRGRTICEVHNHANAGGQDVGANAALIASAPALAAEAATLKAQKEALLRAAEHVVDTWLDRQTTAATMDDSIKDLRAAITAAEGGRGT